jgi:four helix bundle protein
MTEYQKFENTEIYQQCLKAGDFAWQVYERINWSLKKVIGEQYIRSIDSVGANFIEGYGRFHYLDRIKFYYNSRGSLFEAKGWSYLLEKRKIISAQELNYIICLLEDIHRQLNSIIKMTYSKKN